MTPLALSRTSFPALLEALRKRGYRVVGPVARDGAVMWEDIRQASDLPVGWRDTQEPGRYRLEQTGSGSYFGVVHGPESAKRFAFAPHETLITIERTGKTTACTPVPPPAEPIALIGARACDLAGLAIQDRIFLRDAFPDPYYAARRRALLLIGVNCTRALATCFCASRGTGPEAREGFDLVLTELDDVFLIKAGSPAGQDIVKDLPLAPATEDAQAESRSRIEACARSQTRTLDTARLPAALYEAHDHARWDDVAARCLACGNCTMVCPTCFCHAEQETPDLGGQRSERARLWDSCFTQEHGYIHGKNMRPTTKDRYRMWLTHKLASWIDQFGMSGCVGCGRCITWCPVGIDLTVELPALLTPKAKG